MVIESDLSVNGPFAEQPKLVQFGSVLAWLEFIVFLNYVPVALIVWVVLLRKDAAGDTETNWLTWAAVAVLLLLMLAIGVWCIGKFYRWLRGDQISITHERMVVGGITFGSTAVAFGAAKLGVWAPVLIGLFATLVLMAMISALSIFFGKRIART